MIPNKTLYLHGYQDILPVREDLEFVIAYFEKVARSQILGHEVAIILAFRDKTVNIKAPRPNFRFLNLFFSPSTIQQRTNFR
jgi:hypothetical protein